MPRGYPKHKPVLIDQEVRVAVVVDVGLVGAVVQQDVGLPEGVVAEVHLLDVVEDRRVPLEAGVGPAHPHPGVDRENRRPLVEVDMNHGQSEADCHRLRVILHRVDVLKIDFVFIFDFTSFFREINYLIILSH